MIRGQNAIEATGAKPDWLRKKLVLGADRQVKSELRALKLHSVCEEASCPNLSECFSKGVATVMIMGDICTRTCKFCNVASGKPKPLDPFEPQNVATWIQQHGFKHIVITSVDRDDLKIDLGSTHFAKVCTVARQINPLTTLEVLTPDFQGRHDCLARVCATDIKVFNHNLETTRALTPHVRSASDYDRSLGVLKFVKTNFPHLLVKSGIMLGLGESKSDVVQSLCDLKNSGCDLLTLGQYLRPSLQHLPVQAYIHPDQFLEYKEFGERELGFKAVFAGPFVRSSYLADEFLHGFAV